MDRWYKIPCTFKIHFYDKSQRCANCKSIFILRFVALSVLITIRSTTGQDKRGGCQRQQTRIYFPRLWREEEQIHRGDREWRRGLHHHSAGYGEWPQEQMLLGVIITAKLITYIMWLHMFIKRLFWLSGWGQGQRQVRSGPLPPAPWHAGFRALCDRPHERCAAQQSYPSRRAPRPPSLPLRSRGQGQPHRPHDLQHGASWHRGESLWTYLSECNVIVATQDNFSWFL